MSHKHISVSGKILHLFAHRVVVETMTGAILADVTPEGIGQIALHVGDTVTLEGEMKPSELKVARLTLGARSVQIAHRKKPHRGNHGHAPADAEIALNSARAAGYEPVGAPRRKPKHFEVLGRRRDTLTELHIELDGNIRKFKPASAEDPKWQTMR